MQIPYGICVSSDDCQHRYTKHGTSSQEERIWNRHSPDGRPIRSCSWVEKPQARLLNSAKEPIEPLGRLWLTQAAAKPRRFHPLNGASGAPPPSGSSMTASACRLNIAQPAVVEGHRSSPACGGAMIMLMNLLRLIGMGQFVADAACSSEQLMATVGPNSPGDLHFQL